ncbi:PAS domain S-box containing protein [Nitzschia inconspicua]|uniref:PAS domain S-box containing protein n=1 Tax=Nitzschia inconspicua TaxID=303405 RepID=A0A9K3P796_9STRA|nr:PAS domain S-box containing protein [Nitzschia inconspicua]KAG7353988.1 PAS domain S-box containing protein [Nitzschia inconspicua]
MAKAYADFNRGDDNEGDDDEDIGALESILSWDEDEDGGGGGAMSSALSDRDSMHNSTLPDLVSFNPKDSGLSYLQHLTTGSGGTIDPAALNLPLPTRIHFQNAPNETQAAPSEDGRRTENAAGVPKVSRAGAAAVTQAQQQKQLQQQQQQQQQIQQQQQQQIQQHHHLQQQIQQQQQQQLGAQAQASASQQQQAQQLNQQQAAAAAASLPVHLQGAFNLLQQNALLAQQAQNALSMPQQHQQSSQPGQEHNGDQHQQSAAPQFIDPNAFLRQLQVAQLQQQFNAVQQAAQAQAQSQQQAMGATASGSASGAALQQQMSFQGQIPMGSGPTGHGTIPIAARKAPNKRPPTSTQPKFLMSTAAKAPLVSASDTDGELSLKQFSQSKGGAKKAAAAAARKKIEIDMSNMTPEERANANRDRNREHARNTRLRKKAYLEKLKSTVDELCRERDTLVSERAGAANILVEMNNTRTEVLLSFFALRSANEKRRELWSSILDESRFACVMPVTPYRSFPASEVQVSKCQRTILGIDGMMADTASLHVLLNSLVDRSRFPNAVIMFRYTLVTEEAVVAGNQMMARWIMTTLNATQCGARMEVAKQGMLCCKFNSAHKIIGLELMFDVMALMLQLKQAAGSDTFSVVPNTVQTCQRSFDKPMVMILAEEPYTIVQVNKLWEEMTGYKAEEVVGKTSHRILEGEQTDHNAVEVLMNEIRFKRPASAMILQYKKSGERFRNFFLAYPLSTDSRITHYLIFTSHVGPVVDSSNSPTTAAPTEDMKSLPPSNQNAFFAQNLQANFNAAKNAAGLTETSLYPVLADLPQAMRSDCTPGVMQPKNNDAVPTAPLPQSFPEAEGLKRNHPNSSVASNSSGSESRKMRKT